MPYGNAYAYKTHEYIWKLAYAYSLRYYSDN